MFVSDSIERLGEHVKRIEAEIAENEQALSDFEQRRLRLKLLSAQLQATMAEIRETRRYAEKVRGMPPASQNG
jgi:hypothetical protein